MYLHSSLWFRLTSARSHATRVEVPVRATSGEHTGHGSLDHSMEVCFVSTPQIQDNFTVLTIDLLLRSKILVEGLRGRVELNGCSGHIAVRGVGK
jgi:hypothetical protein